MIEIKFRGKRVDNGEWVYGSLAYFFDNKNSPYIMPSCYFGTRDFGEIDKSGNPKIEDDVALGGFIRVTPDTIGQYTGLKDKNSVEIYEGDINPEGIFVVYREDKASFALRKKGWAFDHFFGEAMKGDEFEIKGNIY